MDDTDDQPGCGAALTAIGTIIINFMTGIILVPSTFHFQGSVINTDGLNYYQTEGFPEVTEFAVYDAAGVLSRESHNFFNQNIVFFSNMCFQMTLSNFSLFIKDFWTKI